MRGYPVNRDWEHTTGATIRTALDWLDGRLARLGRTAATLLLTTMAVLAAIGVHLLFHAAQGGPVHGRVLLNIVLEMAAVAGPIIFYARTVIDRLSQSRAGLDALTRRLALTADRAEHASRAKSAFLANMSHELRTPLNAIMGFSEIMKDQHLGPMTNARYLGYAGDIHASGRYLLGIINDILDLSKIEAGKMSLENAEEFPLRQALEASLALCSPLAERFGVTIQAQLPPEHVRLVAVDRMIRQIVINIVGNAIKFTPAGGQVEVRGAPTADGGYAVTVQDCGIGMTETDIEKALTPFGQVENRMTATHNGTGLGLPLAKAMLELHGGALSIRSVPLHGTTIALIFPASRIASSLASAAA
jgi:signal transduction histidine kinase